MTNDGRYYLESELRERSHWAQHVQHDPAVTFRVSENTCCGTGHVVDSATEPDLTAAVATLVETK